MNPNLFKSAEFYQRRYHNFATLLILPLSLLLIFLVLFSFFVKKEVTVISRGEITPTKIIASIQSTSNNPITTNKLSHNQLVKKDELLLQYSEIIESSKKQALDNQLDMLNRQKTELETLIASLEQGTNLFLEEDEFGYSNTFNNFIMQSQDLELGISKINTEVTNQATIANNTVAAIDTQINKLSQQLMEYDELKQAITNRTPNLSSGNPHQATLNNYLAQSQHQVDSTLVDQYLSQINQNISNIESSIANLNIQKAGTGSVASYDNSLSTKIEALRSQFLQNASQQVTTINNQIIEIQAQLEQATISLQNNTITAPETGIIHLNSEFLGKNFIPTSSEIAQIYPNINEIKEVLITYYVSSEYISLLKEHQISRLSLEKIGNQKIMIIGTIQSIDKTATKTEQANLFKVTALVKLSNKESHIIQYGLQGRVTTVIAKKTYFNYYKDKILSNYN
ncbi:bacteriocin secretion accessory protein [Streptococcus cuniculipharyngis]|uniref:Bacteriocin secretion accessory protein n=1 Tax=Streptococcus cuniculipharyngis TaxID=1562651 RepID=A0A5C5SCI9_9STRE|nr:bacteriocin secretion accessory protein [Streptococcus cuniculipharyngis]TWS98797.1 bacteriocin secretion accessory protein [Streptococcus cuniculipharyngis]